MRIARFVLLCLPLALAGLTGCKSACRSLSEKLCDCEPMPTARTICLTDAAQAESQYNTTAEDEDVCQAKLETCTCENLTTPEGKEACGLAR